MYNTPKNTNKTLLLFAEIFYGTHSCEKHIVNIINQCIIILIYIEFSGIIHKTFRKSHDSQDCNINTIAIVLFHSGR